jgi:hypothetical protein
MTPTEWATVATAIVAVYGAALSTYTLLRSRKEARRQVKVKLTWGVVGDTPEPRMVFFLTASNPGQRTVTLQGFHLRFPNGNNLFFAPPLAGPAFPYEVREGRQCAVWAPVRDVVKALVKEGHMGKVKLVAVFRDATDREFRSKPFKGTIEHWSSMAD